MEEAIYIDSFSAEDTYELGRSIGMNANPGLVITMDGDLGAGKTLFTQGLAEGLGITEPVNSPTFTILQIYDTGRLPLYHFDVYRIEDPYEMDEVGFDDFIYGEGVSVIEWSGQIDDILPDDRLEIVISRDVNKGFDYRSIRITNHGKCEITIQ